MFTIYLGNEFVSRDERFSHLPGTNATTEGD